MVVGIIAEYNPFHNGHRYQIEQIRKRFRDAAIVALMSGSFTQRGEPAILDKFTRAKLAINGGCDLVLELPFVFAVRSAQDFARGGIRLLKNLGIVDILAFGAESDDIDLLKNAAENIGTVEFNDILHKNLDSGISYAKAVCQTLSKMTGIDEKILRQPNTILALEYLRALKNSSIQPLLVPRFISNHNDKNLTEETITSASSIRESIYSKNPSWCEIAKTVDGETLSALKAAEFPLKENLFLPLIEKVICSNVDDLKNIYGMNEGLENKIISVIHSSKNLDELLNLMISQRYTRSRIQRLLLHLLIGLQKNHVEQFDEKPEDYARILAFNQCGRELIRSIKKASFVTIINKVAQHITSKMIYETPKLLQLYQQILRFDVISTDVFSILHTNIKLKQDFINSPIYLS